MLHENVLPTTRGTDFGGVQHFSEDHSEFSLGRLCVARSRLIRMRAQLRLSQKRGDKSIGRWCRSIPWYQSARRALPRSKDLSLRETRWRYFRRTDTNVQLRTRVERCILVLWSPAK